MQRLTGEDAGPAPEAHAQPRKRKRHGHRGQQKHRLVPQPAPTTAVQPPQRAPQRAGSLAECNFSLGAALLRDAAGACSGWRGDDDVVRCDACGCGQGAHALLDTRSGALGARRAYAALRDARALGYSAAGSPLETPLAAHAARLSRLLFSTAAADSGIAAQMEQAAALLPGIGSRPGSALRFVALLDEAYAELFIGDCLAPPASSASLPPPHVHLAALLPALPAASGLCSECRTSSPPAAGLLCRGCAGINPQLAYIRLRDAEAKSPLELRRLAAASLAAEGAGPGPSGGTQRGVDPVGCETLRMWQAAVRDRMAAWSAFACPDATAAQALAAFAASDAGGELLEVGAGTGYWARYLTSMCTSMRIAAHDVRPPSTAKGRLNEYHSHLPSWAAVQPGDAAAVAAAAASTAVRAGKPPPALLICYPPPCTSSAGKNDMALAALTAFAAAGGRRLALAGEWRGDTGSPALERALCGGWTLEAAPLDLPGYANTCATLTLWRRGDTGVPSSPCWAPACVACGAAQPVAVDGARTGSERPFLRDRLTRAVVVCSHACARAPAAMAALDGELRARHLPPLRHRRSAQDTALLPFAWEDSDAALGKLVWRTVGV